MPIGGGNWTNPNKVLPGAYINFVSSGPAQTSGSRGIATLPLSLDWGAADIIRVEAATFGDQALRLFGYSGNSPKLLLIREALKRANILLVYRLNGTGVAATNTIGGLTVTAKYPGTRGNDIRVGVAANIDNPEQFDVSTYIGTALVDTQTVAAGAELSANDWITFAGDALSIAAPAALLGGTNSEVTGTDYSNYLTRVEVEQFDAIGYPGTDPTTAALFEAFVKRLRDEDGKKVVGVLYQTPADYEGIINVKNGVILADGTTLTGEKVVAWVTGATAGAEVNESLSNTAYEGAVDVDIKYTKRQYEQAILDGEFVFYPENGRAYVLTDINSLTTLTSKSPDLVSNRVMRVLDGWANEVSRIFARGYLGAATNEEMQRQLLKADLIALGNQYQAMSAISGFVPDDIHIEQGGGKRDVYITAALQPIDAMEKLYMLVEVK